LHRAHAVALWPGAPGWHTGLDDLDDPPLVMFARGAQDWIRTPAVAIVGSRRASAYGMASARRIAAELAALGMVVVSGLARGVDTAAHEGALSVGGRTVAVLGGGLARPYPPENVPLAREIVARAGAVWSEFPLDMPPRPFHFPRRNRVLAALVKAVVVVEAGEKSGSLITADHALDIGREVLAVPGRSDHPNSRGTHRLLREGAALCEGAADVLRALGLISSDEHDAAPAAAGPTTDRPVLDPVEAVLLSHLVGVERHTDDLIALGELDAGVALAALTVLELRGVVRQGVDGRWRRAL
jgi:DNA processing protein